MSRFGMPSKIEGDEYVLHMNAETAWIVSHACELYARIINGQFNEIRYLTLKPLGEHDETFCERIQKCEDALLEAKKAAFPEFQTPANQSYGVGHSRSGDAAWNVYQAVRYVMAWHEHPEGGITVNFIEPLKYSDAPMPRCEVRNEDLEWHDCIYNPDTGELIDTVGVCEGGGK